MVNWRLISRFRSMIHAYSKRLSPPYTGQVQIAESDRARALTLDGKSWEIQFCHSMDDARQAPPQGQAAGRKYIRIATIQNSEIRRIALPTFLDIGNVDDRIIELSEFIATSELPYPASDYLEYWLLDAQDESPLAMIHSCSRHEDMPAYPNKTEWTALPASMMAIEPRSDELEIYVPPVNYRFERLVAERAGQNPRAAWFNRHRLGSDGFPPCLVSEQWADERNADLCQRYIQRQAPRLLMLHDLGHDDRVRLEQAARQHALEVDRFYRLYPAVADQELMAAIRVEANLRRASDPSPA